MLRHWLVGAALLLSACQISPDRLEPTASNSGASFAQQAVAAPSDLRTVRTTLHGTEIAVTLSSHWQVDEHNGLVIAENVDAAERMVLYLFIPSGALFPVVGSSETANRAFELLRRVVDIPAQMGGNFLVSNPQHLRWQRCDVSYYLLAGSDGVNSLVMAVDVPGSSQPVVLNVSMPQGSSHLMRERLTEVLDAVTINDVSLSSDILNHLPDPLEFPMLESDDSDQQGSKSLPN
ncbi:MAG: hypothetical protein IPK19_03090 [Chloroflexi bacterium]|nr:hypothetical protein [Chloroflexota bacterium]